jgi:hypothetical protein
MLQLQLKNKNERGGKNIDIDTPSLTNWEDASPFISCT